MKPIVKGLIVPLAIMSSFSGAAAFADERRCAPYDILEYDLQRKGLSLQSTGSVASDTENHSIELYANSDTGAWTIMELQGDEEPCFYQIGAVFFHESPAEEEGLKTFRQSALARHGKGDDTNAAYELYAHMSTGRWFLSRRTSPEKSEIILAGDEYTEINRTPYAPIQNIGFEAE